MNNNTTFTFHSHMDSFPVQHFASSEGNQAGPRKRKSSYEDISPLVMKTRSGIGLEQEIVYDRTMTLMMQGQRRLLEEQKQKEQQEHELLLQQQQYQKQQQLQALAQKESPAEAMRRLFAFSKAQPSSQQQQQQHLPFHSQVAPYQNSGFPTSAVPLARAWTFSDCAGEISGCETSRIPGMRDRYQALIDSCSICQRPQCQFCAVNCLSCQAFACRACCVTSYEKSDVEHYCRACRT
ncbi:hypothetical protein BC939DRAFT_443982 [Gamsiella multidivaricata]|uniref:uncharacterized protein n=1 Tax=Gamsiella multidivaricata TaxID=101098 RepID=UPI00221F58B2|nr:uncharacterized protein BC939DRAFT_443982 [Gamsiella multidivaricata]KAI7828234.1 hypothetical protein BC939DRAFT_443982 [Gamsiella multidivaricata]